MIKRRNRVEQTVSFKERLQSFAKDLRQEASSMPPCERKSALLKRARVADTAVHIDAWVSSPALAPK